MVGEVIDTGHYYLAPYELVNRGKGDTSYEVVVFTRRPDAEWVDLREPSQTSGYALVRSATQPTNLPASVVYVGKSLLAPLPMEKRAYLRSMLSLRGQVQSVKDVLYLMLLSEAGERGKPAAITPERDGAMVIYLGDLRVGLPAGA